MKKILKYLFCFAKAKWSISKLPNKKILILDVLKKKIILTLQKNEEFFFLHTRGEKFYVKPFLKTIFQFKFKQFMNNYIIECIKEAKPNIIFSIVSSNSFYWKLKKIFPEKKIIIIQGEKLTKTSLFISAIKTQIRNKLKIDYFFLWNKYIKKELAKYIDTKFIVHGSIINNNFQIKNQKKRGYALVSQISNYGDQRFDENKSKKISEIFEMETTRLIEYFSNHYENKKLYIMPYNEHNSDSYQYEKNFFKKISKKLNQKIEILYKMDEYSNYEMLDTFKIVFGLTSSLLLENLSRGNRTGFFNYLIQNKIYHTMFKKKKYLTKIYTEENDYNNFSRILNFLDFSTKYAWRNTHRLTNKNDEKVYFDSGNSQLKKIILECS